MQLNELRTLLAIVETGSLIRAAEKLNVTQSTVTARLKSLEAELGQVLINRQKSGASLTGAGVRLHRYASTISDLWKQACQETALPEAMSSVCNIGCHPDLWSGVGERLFDFMRCLEPPVAISVWQGNQRELVSWLDDGLIDLALSYSQNASQAQDVVTLLDDQLILVSTNAASPIKFDPGYVFVEAGEEFGRDHAAAYADANTTRISFGSSQLGLEYILKHGGTAYLPKRVVADHISNGELFRLEEAPDFTRRAFLIVNRSATQSWPWYNACLELLNIDA